MKISDINIRQKTGSWNQTYSKIRVYVWPKGENMMANLENRRTRPYNDYRKAITPTVRTILEQEGITWNPKMSWSQKAGCGCGCSPGFVVDAKGKIDIHIDITE